MTRLQLDIKSELPKAIKWTNEHTKQLPFSISQAINASVQGSKFLAGSKQKSALNAAAGSMPRFLDKPKPQTAKGLRATAANKRTLASLITPKDKPWNRNRYISGNIFGGNRAPKPFEIALAAKSRGEIPRGSRFVPTGAIKPNQFGNISKSNLNKIINSIGTTNQRGQNIFVGKPVGGGRQPGVYRRERNGRLRPLFLTESQVTYTPRLQIVPVMQQKISTTFGPYLRYLLARNVRQALGN